MISVSDVNLTFETNDGPVNALKNVSMEVNEGDFVSFIGPSGCGKTTLLRVIAALETKHATTETAVEVSLAEVWGQAMEDGTNTVQSHDVKKLSLIHI